MRYESRIYQDPKQILHFAIQWAFVHLQGIAHSTTIAYNYHDLEGTRTENETRSTVLGGEPHCMRLVLKTQPGEKTKVSLKKPKNLQPFQGWKQLPLLCICNSEHLWFARQKRDTTFLIHTGLSLRRSGVT